MREHILIVDDEENIRKTLLLALKEEGYRVSAAKNSQDALKKAKDADVCLLDLMLKEEDGLKLLQKILRQNGECSVQPPPVCVMMSGYGSIETALKATQIGAFDFLEKPLSLDKLLLVIRNSLEKRSLQFENLKLRLIARKGDELLGRGKLMTALREKIQKAASRPARVLIQGESGTGKELAARAIHAYSPRSKMPFIKLNCAAIPQELIESELFGNEAGAFTGAMKKRTGKFEQADQGTIFLDEIGDMRLEAQAKVLRVLQEGEFERLGGNKVFRVDVRVLAATNKNLSEEIKKGNFREDLFYRLNVVPIIMPPLREHKEDIPLLVQRFLEEFAGENGEAIPEAEESLYKALSAYDWPGNVRELKNVVERIMVLRKGDELTEEDVRDLWNENGEAATDFSMRQDLKNLSLKQRVDFFEAAQIRQVLEETKGKVSQAAKILSLERSHLYKKMAKLGIR